MKEPDDRSYTRNGWHVFPLLHRAWYTKHRAHTLAGVVYDESTCMWVVWPAGKGFTSNADAADPKLLRFKQRREAMAAVVLMYGR